LYDCSPPPPPFSETFSFHSKSALRNRGPPNLLTLPTPLSLYL
jgi:hypothetical protein